MLLTLNRNLIINDGKRGTPRQAGEHVEVKEHDARYLLFMGQAKPYESKSESKSK